jgi:cytidine deaminase
VEPLESERRVIAAAESLARTLGGDPNHTTAAAAMDTRGRIHTAVNVYHFTGGPCAELAVLGVAAAANAGPLLTMAAAGDTGRGLMPPCGRCRQVMLDLHPDIFVAVPSADGPQMRPIRKLLPDTYFSPDASARRIVRFHKRYYEAIVAGTKTTTVRWEDPVALGPATFVFEDHPENAMLDGEVLAITRHELGSLTPEQAHLPAGTDMAEYRRGLRGHYPDLPDDADVDVVSFTVAARR